MFKNVLTVHSLAKAVAGDLGQGRPAGESLRLVRQFIADARRMPSASLADSEFAPSTTGSPRWDALIAAAVDMVLTEHSWPLPAWLIDPEPLDQWWFFNAIAALNPRSLIQAPPQFAMRGVFIQRAALENL